MRDEDPDRRSAWIRWVALLALAAACSGQEPEAESAAARGKTLYDNICVTCHNRNPKLDGSVGPAVAGASAALIEARVLHGSYPPGYTPKRPGHTMPVFPFLKDSIGDLAAYLDQASRD